MPRLVDWFPVLTGWVQIRMTRCNMSIQDDSVRLVYRSSLRGPRGPRWNSGMFTEEREEHNVQAPIAPCLWFDNNAEEAVNYYISIFKDSKITSIDRYSETGPDPDGQGLFIEFQINGQPFQALNGGPIFTFSEATSFSITCADQEEVDYYWDTFTRDGEPSQCGWLKDKYGVSWQIVPEAYYTMIREPDRVRAGQMMRKMLTMSKLNVAELEAAYNE